MHAGDRPFVVGSSLKSPKSARTTGQSLDACHSVETYRASRTIVDFTRRKLPVQLSPTCVHGKVSAVVPRNFGASGVKNPGCSSATRMACVLRSKPSKLILLYVRAWPLRQQQKTGSFAMQSKIALLGTK